MARHIHIHLHVHDGIWEEHKHKRSKNGEFESGGAPGASSKNSTVSLKGNELGTYANMKELRQKALAHAERFIGKSFKNEATGNDIQISKTGVKHTIANSSDDLVRTVPAIPELIRNATLVSMSPDKGADPNIHAVEKYSASVELDGKTHRAILTVKVYRDGRRYYDHGLVK